MNINPNILNKLGPGVFTTSRVFALIVLIMIAISALSAQDYKTLEVTRIFKLDKKLAEISGITYLENKIYAINDSGNKSEVYILDENDFDIDSSARINGAKNHDWEEICSYNNTLYIGDFGNNSGSRENLRIYKIPADSLSRKELEPGIIKFRYYHQDVSILSAYRNHRWDCEAMVVNSIGIWLFSKDWEDRICRLYFLKNQSESKVNIKAIDSLNLKYLVTGAFYDNVGGKLYLCGYEENIIYLTVMQVDENINFSGEYTSYIIPELKNTQVESVFVKENVVYLASERTRFAQAVYKIVLPNFK